MKKSRVEKKEAFPQYAAFIDDLVVDLGGRLPSFGGYTHANPDIQRVVAQGFNAMEQELDEQIIAVEEQGAKANNPERHLLAALKDYTLGVRAFYNAHPGSTATCRRPTWRSGRFNPDQRGFRWMLLETFRYLSAGSAGSPFHLVTGWLRQALGGWIRT